MPLQYELVFQNGNQRFYQLNFLVTTSDEQYTPFVCISDALVYNRYERFVFPVISKNGMHNEEFEPIIDYLEIDSYDILVEEGDYSYLPSDEDILKTLYVYYKTLENK